MTQKTYQFTLKRKPVMNNVLDLRKAFGTKTVVQSICEWNAARYDQVPSPNLTVDLLNEELKEAMDAEHSNDLVEVCDGYGDVFYVAVGSMWKHGLEHDEIIALIDALEDLPLPPIQAGIVWYSIEQQPAVLGLIALRALEQLGAGLGSADYALDIIRAICTSNDTKPAQRTDSNVKANLDKGAKYVPPTESIKKIIKQSIVTGGINVS